MDKNRQSNFFAALHWKKRAHSSVWNEALIVLKNCNLIRFLSSTALKKIGFSMEFKRKQLIVIISQFVRRVCWFLEAFRPFFVTDLKSNSNYKILGKQLFFYLPAIKTNIVLF